MVSEDTAPNSMHHFIIPNHHEFNPYGTATAAPANPISDNTLYPLMDLLGADGSNPPPQRLSLSLGGGSVPCRQSFSPAGYLGSDYSFPAPPAFVTSFNHHQHQHQQQQPCSTSSYNGNDAATGFSAAIGSSRYLKAAQSLLQEMVSVGGREIEASNHRFVEKLSRAGPKGFYGLSAELKPEFSDSELCICLLKLLAMLEELERRYEEYYQHMEELVSSFEMVAGLGTGNSYTALALHAMSKHFCTLRTAIVAQIRATKQKIDKDAPKISSRLAQLSLFDNEARHNRASLQQIGLMHNSRQAWRPIRGLPETSVTLLRAWLFEHFLHPYPNDSEKLMLASQTGLSKNQVSNWFINARVRLWKPMIEEMYKEEFAESSTESDQLLTSSSTREGAGDSAEDFI